MQDDECNREKPVILGTSLFGPEVLDLITDTGRHEVTAFVENWDKEKTRETLAGRPVVWIDDSAALTSTRKALCALGTTHRKRYVQQAVELGFQYATIIHHSSQR